MDLKNLDLTDILNLLMALINTVVMGILTYFVYKATKASSDAASSTEKLTRETFNLNKEIANAKLLEEEKYRDSLRVLQMDLIKTKARKILAAIRHDDGSKIHSNLKGLDYEHHISPETLALCFAPDEVELIVKAWSTFRRYIEEFYKEAYNGDDIQILAGEVAYSLDAFDRLLNLLETQVR